MSKRREFLKSLTTALLAAPGLSFAQGKGRFRSAICAYSFRNQLKDGTFTYADLIRMASDLGADGVDLTSYWLPDSTDATLFPLKKLAYRSGVSIYTVGIRPHMAAPTPELRDAELATVRKGLDIAEKLGAGHVRVFGGSVPKGATEDQAVAWAVETLKRAAEEAGKRGITLGLEDDGGITTNADRTIEIFKKTASPWVGINLDIGNFPDNGYAQIEMCAPYATNVHAKEFVHVGGKAEPVDWPRVLRILGAAGYKGYLALEYESNDDPFKAVPKLIAQMQSAIRGA